jgi:hypothetical protein
VIELMASGGMGEVFRAEHIRLKRPVCIKAIHPSLAADTEMLERFEREATVLAGLRHPNVVSVLDLGQLPDGGLYLVLELVDGQNLRELLRSAAPLPLARVIELGRQILAALEEVHQHGVVHRDLKPANVLVRTLRDGSEVVQLVDFGIAKQVRDPALTDSGLTKTGSVIGTPGYIAPEQILGDTIDGRADLYACGVLIFEMLTGKRLFGSESSVDLLRKHLLDPPPSLLLPGHEQVDLFLARALEKSPQSRFADAGKMRTALLALNLKPVAIAVPVAAAAPAPTPVQPRVRPEGMLGLMEQWRDAAPVARNAVFRQIEALLAEWLGQGKAERLLQALTDLKAQGLPDLETQVRSVLVERVGAVVRVLGPPRPPSELQAVLQFTGLEGQDRLLANLRTTEAPAQAAPLAQAALLAGPLRVVVDRLGKMGAIGVGSVIAACRQHPFSAVRPLLVLGINHAEADARAAALNALTSDQAMPLASEVRKRLGDREASVRIAAARALSAVEDGASVPLMGQLLRRADVGLDERKGLFRGLGELGGQAAALLLRAEFGTEKQLELRCEIAEALGRIGDATSLELLKKEAARMLAPAALKAACLKHLPRAAAR